MYTKDQSFISRHIRNILKDKEVDEKSNMQKMHIAISDIRVIFYQEEEIKEQATVKESLTVEKEGKR
ncbi:MAG: hypothetical protein ACTIJ9_16240 [Aequorivita sp.]